MSSDAAAPARLVRLHLTVGWAAVALFALVGLGLEALHGLKVSFYLDVGNETRRLLWTLGHSHGTLLGLVHVGFALTAERTRVPARTLRAVSRALLAAFLLPAGFFLGGVVVYGADPSVFVLLVPAGAVALVVGAGLLAGTAGRRDDEP